jgi:predicted small lipoprotein YifL
MATKLLLLLVLLPLAACGRGGETPAEGPPAAALARITGTQLHEALGLLDRELVAALEAGLEDTGTDAFIRAEAISDRLLETRFPFEWLRRDGYSVQARIRQIQSLADRIESLLRTAAPRDSALADLRGLRRDVLTFRRDLALGGTGRPIPLERLLAGRDTLNLISGEGATGE